MKTQAELPNLVLEAIGAGTWDWNIPGKVFSIGRVFIDIFGLDPEAESLSDQEWRNLVHPDDLAAVSTRLDAAVSEKSTFHATYRIVKADGSEAWIEGLGRVIETNAEGRAVRMVGAVRDVTAEAGVKAALAETESRLSDIVASIPGAVLRYEIMPDNLSRYSYLSPVCTEIFGIPPEAIQADPSALRQCFTGADQAELRSHYLDHGGTPEPFEMNSAIRTPAGQDKHVRIISRPKRQDDGSVTWTTIVFDTTRQVRLERELSKSREHLLHTRKLDAIGELSGGIAHDFNNLLSVVLGNLELMREDGAPPGCAEFIDEAIAATERGSALTRSLLSFARKAHLHPSPLDLNEVIRSMHLMLHRTLPANIAVETSLMGGLWQVNIDRGSVENSLLNLVINARDAMPGGGRLTIETSNIRLTDEYVEERQEAIPPGRYVMVAVTDSGGGIAPEMIDKVFEPFYTTKAAGKGTGLGLSSALGFTKQSGGTTRIYSEVGVGTSVKMYFRAEPGRNGYVPRVPEAHPGNRKKILLVEDEDAVRKVMRLRLLAEGFHVTEAASGDEGLKLFLAERPFDIVLTDIVMPGKLMGTGMVREMRRIDRDVRAIFMSGYPTEAAIHGNGVNEDDVQLMKPVSKADLLQAIGKILQRGA